MPYCSTFLCTWDSVFHMRILAVFLYYYKCMLGSSIPIHFTICLLYILFCGGCGLCDSAGKEAFLGLGSRTEEKGDNTSGTWDVCFTFFPIYHAFAFGTITALLPFHAYLLPSCIPGILALQKRRTYTVKAKTWAFCPDTGFY